jgi:acetyl-CoA carboxylase alpha subunit
MSNTWREELRNLNPQLLHQAELEIAERLDEADTQAATEINAAANRLAEQQQRLKQMADEIEREFLSKFDTLELNEAEERQTARDLLERIYGAAMEMAGYPTTENADAGEVLLQRLRHQHGIDD